jgi:hypothetical protein
VAAVVLDVTSVKKIEKTEKTTVSPIVVETPVTPTRPCPSASENPVRNIAPPSERPPPEGREGTQNRKSRPDPIIRSCPAMPPSSAP